MAFSVAAPAVDRPRGRDLSLTQLEHTAITDDTFDVAANDMAQDVHGFLWLAGHHGLIRYDGVRFDAPVPGLSKYPPLLKLLLGPSGTIDDAWVGHQRDGATHLAGGRMDHYSGGGLPHGSVFALARDGRGVIWAATPYGVARFVDGAWRGLDPSFGYPVQQPEELSWDARAHRIVIQDGVRGILVSAGGTAPFTGAPDAALAQATAALPPGAPWVRRANDDGSWFYDSHGSLWHAEDTGLSRSRWSSGLSAGAPDIRETLTRTGGLTSDIVLKIMEDREGDIWVSTTLGLDRFRRPHMPAIVLPTSVETPLVTLAADGAVWVASMLTAPYRLDRDGRISHVEAIGSGISAVRAEPDGTVWFAGLGGVRSWTHGAVRPVALPSELEHVGTRFGQVIGSRAGDLWLVARSFGLYRRRAGTWGRVNGVGGLPNDTPQHISAAPDGTLWLAYPDHTITLVKGDVIRHLGPSAGLDMGSVLVIAFDGQDAWVGGETGLAWWHGGRFYPVGRSNGQRFRTVDGLARPGDGSLWMTTADGLMRISPEQVERFTGNPAFVVSLEDYDRGELTLAPVAIFSGQSTLVPDGKGAILRRLTDRVTRIDPGQPLLNDVAPLPQILSVTADQNAHLPSSDLVLPPLPRTVRIDYTAPMLRRPERGSFSYRLDGVDTEWQKAGTRRAAFYTNLSPGAYTFRVRAFNEDGVGNDDGARLTFRVSPAWYQTTAFYAACVLLLVFSVTAVWRWHLGVVTERLRVRMDERERIARDLHDTLLQGIQGLILHVHSLRRYVEQPEGRRFLERALHLADNALAEGRDKVSNLRLSLDDPADLRSALIQIGGEVFADDVVAYEVNVTGRPRRMQIAIGEEIYRIARESVINAYHHGKARTIDISIEYGRRYFTLTIRDDGSGFDPTEASDHAGHWGLAGMRERAARIRAAIEVRSTLQSGTIVSLRMRGGRVYDRSA